MHVVMPSVQHSVFNFHFSNRGVSQRSDYLPWTQEVGGSNPSAPIRKTNDEERIAKRMRTMCNSFRSSPFVFRCSDGPYRLWVGSLAFNQRKWVRVPLGPF